MSTPITRSVSVLKDILEEHYEEMSFLWGQRQASLRAADHSVPVLVVLEERIEAHVQGLLIASGESRQVVQKGLQSEDSACTFASAFTLMRAAHPETDLHVMNAFREARGAALAGILQALCHVSLNSASEAELEKASVSGELPVAAAAIEILAFHRKLDPAATRGSEFFAHESPDVRRSAFRMVSLLS